MYLVLILEDGKAFFSPSLNVLENALLDVKTD